MVISFILVQQEFKNNNCYFECRADLQKKINPDRDKITIGDRNPSRIVIEWLQDNSLVLATPFYNVTLQRQVLFLRELKMLARPTQSSN